MSHDVAFLVEKAFLLFGKSWMSAAGFGCHWQVCEPRGIPSQRKLHCRGGHGQHGEAVGCQDEQAASALPRQVKSLQKFNLSMCWCKLLWSPRIVSPSAAAFPERHWVRPAFTRCVLCFVFISRTNSEADLWGAGEYECYLWCHLDHVQCF